MSQRRGMPPSSSEIDLYLHEGPVASEGSAADPVLQAYYAAQLFPLSYRSLSSLQVPLPHYSRYCQDALNPVRAKEWRNIVITAHISVSDDAHDMLADGSVVPKKEGWDDYGNGYLLMEKLVGFHGRAIGSTKNRHLITYVENHPGKGRGCGTVFYPFLEFDRECDLKAAVVFIKNRIRQELLNKLTIFEFADVPWLVHDRVMAFLASKGIEPPPPEPDPTVEQVEEIVPPPPTSRKKK